MIDYWWLMIIFWLSAAGVLGWCDITRVGEQERPSVGLALDTDIYGTTHSDDVQIS